LLAALGGSEISSSDPNLGPRVKSGRDQDMRAVGHDLQDKATYQRLADTIRLPMLERALTWIIASYSSPAPTSGGSTSLDLTIYLAWTNQPGAPKGDTVTIAPVIAQLLQERYPGVSCVLSSLFEVVDEPQSYARQYRDWDARLKQFSLEHEDATLIVRVSGGIPAVNWGILTRGLQHFRGRCVALYVPYDFTTQQSGKAERFSIGEDVWREEAVAALREALAEHRYPAALGILERYSFCFEASRRDLMCAGLSLLAARADFDFDGAQSALDSIPSSAATPEGLLAEELTRQRVEVACLSAVTPSPEQARARLAELFHNSLLQLSSRHYADFLTRYIALLDSLHAYLVYDVTKDARLLTGTGTIEWAEARLAAAGGELSTKSERFKRATERRVARGHEPDYLECFDDILSDPASDYALSAAQQALRYYHPLAVSKENPPFGCLNWEGLAGERAVGPNWQNVALNALRNKCYLNHGFQGVSWSDIASCYQTPFYKPRAAQPAIVAQLGETWRQEGPAGTANAAALGAIVGDLCQALASLGIDIASSPYDSPYERLADALRLELDRAAASPVHPPAGAAR
jgi:hypothetical protein